ncbi:TIGR02449 family protein [Candidatus Sororendozoicomonas aggregata]|uniref:TIGR02449 family protein n=1 Tax=Candidatus Sororendozoicomonas aggregata TaxID=3073239 RepID=UPI002ED44328
MNNPDFKALEQKISYLMILCERYNKHNERLRYREKQLQSERERLVEKNKNARTKVEAMISRLRALEHEL